MARIIHEEPENTRSLADEYVAKAAQCGDSVLRRGYLELARKAEEDETR